MKALLMRSYNPAEIVDIMKVDKDLIEKAKKKDIKLSHTLNDEYDVEQTLTYSEGLILREKSSQTTDRFNSKQVIEIKLKEGDILLQTDIGYKVNLLPIKLLTDKEERLILKYNEVGK